MSSLKKYFKNYTWNFEPNVATVFFSKLILLASVTKYFFTNEKLGKRMVYGIFTNFFSKSFLDIWIGRAGNIRRKMQFLLIFH